LIENSIQGAKIENSIIGIGLNVNQVSFNDQFNAVSLINIFERSFDLNKLLNKIIRQMEDQFLILKSGNKELLKNTYLDNLYWLNEKHTFISSSKFDGIIKGIDPIGRLEVKTDKGLEKFNFKEIKYLE
jgi:BirA family biotin operon repressor/biotin-[acetyl-CoA-carboxylase] ligase